MDRVANDSNSLRFLGRHGREHGAPPIPMVAVKRKGRGASRQRITSVSRAPPTATDPARHAVVTQLERQVPRGKASPAASGVIC